MQLFVFSTDSFIMFPIMVMKTINLLINIIDCVTFPTNSSWECAKNGTVSL